MRVRATTDSPPDTGADTIVVGVLGGEKVHHDHDGVVARLVASGEARHALGALASTHSPDGERRYVLVGLGTRADRHDPIPTERVREAAAKAYARAKELGATTICWEVPHHVGDGEVAAIVDGTLLAAYEYTATKAPKADARAPQELVVCAHDDVAAATRAATIVAEATNAARELADLPPNVLTPQELAARAAQLLADVEVDVKGRAEIEALGMGAFAAVARASAQEPQLITLRYAHPDADPAATLGLVGKAVTFDSGGLSIKPAGSMETMKYDMAGGAAVIGALRAIAALQLPVNVVGVVGATENVIAANAMRPGDVVTTRSGTTVEIRNTDAEGRLVLADCLQHAREQGATSLVDIATLTGAIVVALGDTHAGLYASDDALAQHVLDAGARADELLWRMPLHPHHDELLKTRYADIAHRGQSRKAMASTAAAFLRRFAGEVPWAHVDMAAMSDDAGRPWAAKGATGWGVRLLVELARGHAAGAAD